MGKKNAYLQKQKIRTDVYQTAAADTERQYMVDVLCLVLNDPTVMGKDVFGKQRLQRIVAAIQAEYDHWGEALTTRNEADYYRVKLDAQLRAILGDDLIPFEERYPWLASADTIKTRK